MSTKKGQETLKRWKELVELAKNTDGERHAHEGVNRLEGLEASIEEREEHFEIILPCEVKKGEGHFYLDIPYKTNAIKVAFSPSNFLNEVATHLGYREGDRLEFKIRLPKLSSTS